MCSPPQFFYYIQYTLVKLPCQALISSACSCKIMLISYDWEVCVMILFRHAQIYDGTGQKPFLGDVLVRNDRIAEVGQNLEVPEDTEILEADGKLLCPGFIDIHRHADVQLLLNSKGEAELRQGITTAVSRTRDF